MGINFTEFWNVFEGHYTSLDFTAFAQQASEKGACAAVAAFIKNEGFGFRAEEALHQPKKRIELMPADMGKRTQRLLAEATEGDERQEEIWMEIRDEAMAQCQASINEDPALADWLAEHTEE